MLHATIAKSFRFEAAHQLPHHAGKCAGLHGHSYLVQVRAHGPVDQGSGESSEGMVLDFGELKAAWQELYERLDHRFLNDVLDFTTTAENLAGYLLEVLHGRVAQVCAVRVYETTSCWAEVAL